MYQNLHSLDSGKNMALDLLIRGPMFINFHFHFIFVSYFFNGCMEFKAGASFIQKATFNILPNFLEAKFIPCPSFILESLVNKMDEQ